MQQSAQGEAMDGSAISASDDLSVYAGEERRRAPRSPIAKLQWAIPRVDFILPEHVPTREAIRLALDPETLAACLRVPAGTASDRALALAALAALLPDEIDERSCDLAGLVLAGDGANPEVHDVFFRVRRVGHGHPAGYLQAILVAHAVLTADVETASTTLDEAHLIAIERALLTIFAVAIGGPLPKTEARLSTNGLRAVEANQAIRRWIHGHQVFAALTQGLIFAFDAIEAATEAGDDALLFEAADLAALALEGCAGSLRFTGDFPEEVYESLIRQSMGAPFQPDGFSGLLSSDHRHLVRRMKLTKPSLDALREREAPRYERISSALAGVYDAHKCVCSQFVGTDRSSLMMVRDVGRSAIDHLDRFKAARLRSIGVEETQVP